MSCQACETAQELNDAPDAVSTLKMETYVRVGNGNVMLSGCYKHLTELMGKSPVVLKPHPDMEIPE